MIILVEVVLVDIFGGVLVFFRGWFEVEFLEIGSIILE